MGRWPEAAADLERALPQLPRNAALHATLAQAYRRLDLPDLARQHERLAALHDEKKKGNGEAQ